MTDIAQSRDQSSASSSALLTFLIAGVRGYTRFTVEQGDEAASQLAGAFAEIATEVAAAHEGEVIELRGDEALAVFGSARSALRCAVELQHRLTEHMEADPSVPLRVGVGLDAGEAVPVEGGYRGAALNLAARLCSLAGPGEVLASDTVANLARKVEGLIYSERGLVELKGFTEPVRVMQVLPGDGRARWDETWVEPSSPRAREQVLPIGGFLGALPSAPLVGRKPELDRVLQVVDLVGEGAGRLVLLAGEPGAGKTRLAQEITLHLRDSEFLLAGGRCYEPEQTVPYYPFLDVLATVYSLAPAALQRDTARRWPYLGALLPEQIGVPEVAGGGGQDEQQRVFRAAGDFLASVAETRPIGILLDDLLWADSASLKILLHLARHTRTQPVLLLGTYRDVSWASHLLWRSVSTTCRAFASVSCAWLNTISSRAGHRSPLSG